MRAVLKRIVVRGFHLLRDAWVIIGVTFALMVFLEFTYRAQAWVRRGEPAASVSLLPGPPSPFDTMSWARDYVRDAMSEEIVKWEPYVYFANRPHQGTVMSVDSLGHRVTPAAGRADAARTIRVFFFGGSTTFGWFQRDDHTLPAEATRQLQAALGDDVRVVPTNFGVPGRTFTHEIIHLMLQLRSGARPHVVLFYDGVNDVMSTMQNGVAGLPQNEENREGDFERGRAVVADSLPGIRNDVRFLRRTAFALLQRSELAARIRQRAPAPIALRISSDSAIAGLVRTYSEGVRLVEALADDYGFRAIYVWQPALLTMSKPMSPRERWLTSTLDVDPHVRLMRDMHQGAPARLVSALRPIVGDRFVDATAVLGNDSLDVYGDVFGHHFERVNPTIVGSYMQPMVRAARSARPVGATGPR